MINFRLKPVYLFTVMLLLLSNRFIVAQQKDTITIAINANQDTVKISKYIYGQFAEDLGRGNYGGIWVGPNSDIPNYDGIRKDVVQALRKLDVPDVRWPGGCFADEYHWKDGIGPRKDRPKRVNRWGGVIVNNAFGTNEFLRFCKLIGAEPYISGNLGSGTPREMKQWLEYLTYPGGSTLSDMRKKDDHPAPYKIKFWAVGNESWGCGGLMTPQYYVDLYNRYTNFLHDYSQRLFIVASGRNVGWTKVLMKELGRRMDGMSIHCYTHARARKGAKVGNPSMNFSEVAYFNGVKGASHLNTVISRNSAIMDKYDPQKHVALVVDEWGIWSDPLPGSKSNFYQQNSLRDALLASASLDVFNKHADRVKMANIAQMVNVLQAMILTKGPKMVFTPTYYVFKMYKVHQGATYLPMNMHSAEYTFRDDSIPALSATASRDSTGKIHITLSNLNPHEKQDVSIDIRGVQLNKVNKGTILTSGHFDDVNTFDDPDKVKPRSFDGAQLRNGRLTVEMPSKSIVALELQ